MNTGETRSYGSCWPHLLIRRRSDKKPSPSRVWHRPKTMVKTKWSSGGLMQGGKGSGSEAVLMYCLAVWPRRPTEQPSASIGSGHWNGQFVSIGHVQFFAFPKAGSALHDRIAVSGRSSVLAVLAPYESNPRSNPLGGEAQETSLTRDSWRSLTRLRSPVGQQ